MALRNLRLDNGLLRHGDYSAVLKKFDNFDLVLTSPPYNIGSGGDRQDGYRKKGQFDRKSFGGVKSYFDTWPEETYQELQRTFLTWAANKLSPNGVIA